MARKSQDVELVIKARDEAKRVLESLNAGLEELTKSQDKAGKSADKTGDLVGQLGAEFQDLNKQLQGLAALGKIAGELDRAAKSVNNIDTEVKSAATNLADLARQSQVAATRANQLKGQLDAETAARDENNKAIKESKAELREVDRLLKQVQNSQSKLAKTPVTRTPGVGLDEGARRTDARASASVFVAADQERINREIRLYAAEVTRAEKAISDLKPAVAAAANQQDKLVRETDKSAVSLRRQREELQASRTNLAEIRTISDQANSRLGALAGTQDQVAAASARMAVQMAAAKARIDALSNAKAPKAADSGGTGITGDEKALASQRRAMLEARKEWVQSQTAVKALAQELRAAEQPTEALGAAFGEAQARARLASQEYERQALALHRLGGAATTNFRTFSQAATQMRAAGSATAALGANTSAAVATQGQLASAVNQTATGMGRAASSTNGMRGALGSLYGESRQAMSIMQRLRGEVLSLVTAYIGLHAAINQIGGVITAFKTVEAAQSRLGVVFNQDMGKVSQELAWLNSEAARLGITFQVLSDEYGKFAVAANAANFSAQNTRRIFTSVAEAARVNKLSVDQMSGVFLALQQMISKGKVSSEELRRQLGDRLTGAFNIFADAIGVTTAELDDMMRKGEVLADETNLVKFAEELEKRFGPQLAAALKTTTTEIGRFEKELFDAQLRVAEGGFIDALTNGLRELNQWFASREGRDFFLSLGQALGGFVNILAKVPQHLDLLKYAMLAIVGIKLGPSLASINLQMNAASASTVTFAARLVALRASVASVTASMVTLRGLMAGIRGLMGGVLSVMGGIPGIIATIALVGITEWLTGIDNATSALDEHKRQLGEVQAMYLRNQGEVDKWADKINGVTQSLAEANLADLEAAYAKALRPFESRVQRIKQVIEQIRFAPDGLGISASEQRQMDDVVSAFDEMRAGSITLEDFRKRLDEINRTTQHPGLKEYTLEMQQLLDAADDGEASLIDIGKSIEAQRAIIAGFKGETADAAKELGLLSESADVVNKSFSSEATEKFNASLAEMRGLLPELAGELEQLKEINALDKLYQDALNLARTMGEVKNATDLYGRALEAIKDKRLDKMLDAYGAGSTDVVDRIKYIEGGQNGTGPSTSSARGIGQFTEGTWLGMFDKIYPELAELNRTQKLALRTSEEHANKMLTALTRENQGRLINAGLDANPTNTYLAHFLGAGDAIKVLLANPDELATNIVDKASVSANPSVFKPGMTAQDLIGWSAQKMGGGSPITNTGQTEREKLLADQQEATDKRIADLQFEIEQQRLINDGKEKQAAIEAAITEAKRENPDISEAELQKVREQTAALWEQQHVGEALKLQKEQVAASEEKVNQLYELRQQLLEQQQMYREQGDTTSADALNSRLAEVNGQLQAAIQNAIGMWQAIGGAEADAAIAKLQTTAMSVKKVEGSVNKLGLTMQQVDQLKQSFASGIAGVFDKFAMAIANGEDAIGALRDAFLQFASDFLRQIAQMIIQQAILNALGGGTGGSSGGGSILTAITGLFRHGGGTVGKATGGQTRQFDPRIFANALRYHNGGIAGLKPNEVPTVLEEGEEVLTKGDPRHTLNGGAQSQKGGDTKIINAFDTASFLEAALSTRVGEKAILNFVQANSGAIKGILG